MTKYNLYTVLSGALGVMFSIAVYIGEYSSGLKASAIIFGAAVFAHSAWILYRLPIAGDHGAGLSALDVRSISKITLINRNGEGILSWELYGKTSALIGKDVGENAVDIDLSSDPHAAMVDVEHAVLNYADDGWYVEDLGSKGGLSIRKSGKKDVYKLSANEPCRLEFGDVILVGMCQLRLD